MGRLAFARLLVKNAAIAEAGHPHRCHLERHRDGTMKDFGFAQWARSVRPGVDIVLAGTPERAAHAAGELCEQGPHLMKPYEPKVVLDRIKGLLAARASHGS
jgi:hypothetical protein